MAVQVGQQSMSRATGAVLDRSLAGLNGQIDRSLAKVRVGAGAGQHSATFGPADFTGAVRAAAALEATLFGCTFTVGPVVPHVMLHADQDMLFSALAKLLQNAFKFSGSGAMVTLTVAVSDARTRIDIKDSGPGLSAQAVHDMFKPLTQSGTNKTGLGLGPAIARRSVEGNGGLLTVASQPGQGCTFTIDLPRTDGPAALL